jgi:hypothetical protein
MTGDFTTVRTVGPMLPADLLGRVIAGDKDLTGLTSSDFHLGAGETPREAANRAWSYLIGAWQGYRAAADRLATGDPGAGLTREKWLLLLLRELGYGRVPTTPAGGLLVGDRAFAVSHLWGQVPMHLLGWGVDLDRRTKGVAGAAERAPHAMVQELLNREDRYLWAIVSNGQRLRVLRDSTSLSGQSYLEFDLEAMFDGEVFSDFALLYLTVHQSRLEVLSADGPASDCWLERWRTTSIESGTRALGLLRGGVKTAIEVLGTGFLQHPANGELNRRLADRELSLEDYHRSLLRLIYRLLFLFVAEDRQGLLVDHPDDDSNRVGRARYATYFSTRRLRRIALRRRGTTHGDLWESLSLVIDALRQVDGQPALALPGLGGLFDPSPVDVVTGMALSNGALLGAIRHLSVVSPKGQPKRTVDYRNLGAEELGGIYESLLEFVPRHDAAERTFTLEALAGNDRKSSGSYYTPSALIDLVLDEALDPLLDDAEKSDDPAAALLALTVCDPACGSGHFLVAAARRIAARLASARTGELDPTPSSLQTAMHDVVERCIYGVDVNPMAAELAKVSLWLEALQPGRPLNFLDAHIKVGNALLGTTPALVAGGIPDEAYKPIEGDDRRAATALRAANREQRTNRLGRRQSTLEEIGLNLSIAGMRDELRDLDAATIETLADVQDLRARHDSLENSPDLVRARRIADAWCAAFVQVKDDTGPRITDRLLVEICDGRETPVLRQAIRRIAALHGFFHWHLEFPAIFDTAGHDNPAGWSGGFTCVLGNPPWERIKLQEKEFFASRDPEIANAPNAAARKSLIEQLASEQPGLREEWLDARRTAEGESHFLRSSGRYPLCGTGDINTYSVFAEHMRAIVVSDGRVGVITPTGLATEATTAAFLSDTLRAKRLAAFYDFTNETGIFDGVHRSYRFAVSCITGGEPVGESRLAFVNRNVADVISGRFTLTPEEILMVNPNTGTLPLFASPRDAEITLGIYRRHPVLIRGNSSSGNPWGLRFASMFHMANDSDLFLSKGDLDTEGAQFDGWAYTDAGERYLPLYEAKLLHLFDHRFSSYADLPGDSKSTSLPRLSDLQHGDPTLEPLARYWVAESEVKSAIGERWDRSWLLGWRCIARDSDVRTFVTGVLPRTAVSGKYPVAFPAEPRHAPLLQGIWSSLPFDYISRQKLSGTDLAFFIVKQLASPGPASFDVSRTWSGESTLAEWVRPRVLELTYTSHRIAGYARDIHAAQQGLNLDSPEAAALNPGAPFRWIPERRELIKVELDAAMFHLYGLDRAETEHVLDAFPVLRRYEERDHGEFRTKRLVLERYDAMAASIATGELYVTPLSPEPGFGPRHPVIGQADQHRPAMPRQVSRAVRDDIPQAVAGPNA